MKTTNRLLNLLVLALAFLVLISCGSDDPEPDQSVTVSLSGDDLSNTSPGLYSKATESGEEITVTVNMQSAVPLQGLAIRKTINNTADSDFGTGGTLSVGLSGTSTTYEFKYTPDTDDVDQLVGFNFRATNANGVTSESDMVLVVTLSPIDNLTRRRWNLTSVFHVNENEEGIRDCQKDNSMLLNEDGTIVVDFGEDTGTGDCVFDGFDVYTIWYLTEEGDDLYFNRESVGLFDPETTKVETFKINELTTERIKMEHTIDLTDFGASAEETFEYTYVASPR
ncbi:hypothetical protein [Pararhodonellum marinum]|uniref:hypothetical protein n=1 Tax=Pararhodonellum marinum TaxID=2755358 RepID=UPI00188E1594|nr:hypothetical protein [Pararhodonellum marinum]